MQNLNRTHPLIAQPSGNRSCSNANQRLKQPWINLLVVLIANRTTDQISVLATSAPFQATKQKRSCLKIFVDVDLTQMQTKTASLQKQEA
ncbi:hypothetical protein [Pseudomonas mandelii]|uniref:hypothetical protein n=1 Tax=Pseudomonas mandelii TaxID=75612 RepID=UPI0012DC94F4|nr:hypothetical protein [Pseudomonas mandelii]